MTELPGSVQTTYRDLLELCLAAEFDENFPEGGHFTKKTVKGRVYWYFRHLDKSEKYVGPETPELLQRMENHRKTKKDERQRRTLVGMLKHAGLPYPTPQVGSILQTLARAGVFRVRTCLVGTQAFGCYGGILGLRLRGAAVTTQDLDLAQFNSISVAIAEDERLPGFVDVLKTADPTFRPLTKALNEGRPIAYINKRKYKIEILTPNRGPDRDEPIPLPAIGSYGHGFRFLDFLIYEATPAVVLHGGGVVVNVPAPERFAIHKLIVAHRRQKDREKIAKDLSQATQLITAMWEIQSSEVKRVFEEAATRGPAWQEALSFSLSNIAKGIPEAYPTLSEILSKARQADIKASSSL